MREQQPDAALDAARPPGDRIEPAWVRCWVGCATGLGDPAWSLSWESPPYCPCCWVCLTNAYHWSTAGQLTMFQNAFTYSARKFRYFR